MHNFQYEQLKTRMALQQQNQNQQNPNGNYNNNNEAGDFSGVGAHDSSSFASSIFARCSRMALHDVLVVISACIGVAALVIPIIFVGVVTEPDALTISIFLCLAGVVNVIGSVRLRLTIKIVITLVHSIIFIAVFAVRKSQTAEGFDLEKDGGSVIGLALCYLVSVVGGYTTERSVRKNFAITMREHVEDRQVQGAIALCERLLTNTLPISIIRRMRKDPTKRIVDEVDDASVLYLYIVGQRDAVGDDEMFFEGADDALALDYHEIVDEINEFVFIVDVLCSYHKIEKIKTVPFIVVSGCPELIDHHDLRLACFARDVVCFTEYYNSRHRKGVCVKIGMHSGRVTAGLMGKTKFTYDVFGDTVNLASQIASSSPVGAVRCSQSMAMRLSRFMRVQDDFDSFDMEKNNNNQNNRNGNKAMSSVSSEIVHGRRGSEILQQQQQQSFVGGTKIFSSGQPVPVCRIELDSIPLQVPFWLWEEAASADDAFVMVKSMPDPYVEFFGRVRQQQQQQIMLQMQQRQQQQQIQQQQQQDNINGMRRRAS